MLSLSLSFASVVGARDLGYVQSTVTGHAQALERRLGTRLLDRITTGAVPTDSGQRLLPYAEQLLDLEAHMLAEVPHPTERPAGPVRLTAPESLCAYRLPALVAALRAAEPDVRLSLSPAGTVEALEAIRGGTTDIALILETTLTASDIRVEPLGTEDLALLTSPSSAGAETSLTWADLAAREALLLEEGCSYSDEAARHLLTAGQPATRRTRFGSIEAIKQCTSAGLGWTILPIVTAAPELRAHTLAILQGPQLTAYTVHLATHPNRCLGAAAQLVTDRLRDLWTPDP